jgi:hypothetical protein
MGAERRYAASWAGAASQAVRLAARLVQRRHRAWRTPPVRFRNWFSARGSSQTRQIFVGSDNGESPSSRVQGGET